MTTIKEMGRFCPTDHNGNIINDASLQNIKPGFVKVIEETVEHYKTHLKEDLHSIYIRGSVPRGLGIEGVSDLDTIALTNKTTHDMDLGWVEKSERFLNSKYKCVDGVEFSFFSIEEVLKTDHFSIIPFMIKTHSVCVYGEDVRGHLPEYKADITLGNEHLMNLKRQIDQAKDDFVGNEDKEDIVDCCRWIMKIIVRAGLALVIEKEAKYTRDLYPAYRLFAKHYPGKEPEMRQALQYAVDPVENPVEILGFLEGMGCWMTGEAEKWLDIHNLKRER
ncbi:nucleotidyltransferase [Bacillus sp. MKU004]|nr:nucleotidyltransferase [Bacillus sp. MKU004]